MILGISGKLGSGKDTIADILVRDHRFVKIGLADPLKRICKEVFAFTDEQLFGPSHFRNAPDSRYVRAWRRAPYSLEMSPEYLTPRYALQMLGTEFGRHCYQNVWIDYALRVAKAIQAGQAYDQVRGLLDSGGIVARSIVIPDCRFRNEFDAIRAVDGKIMRVIRPGASGDAHVSETEQDSIADHEFDHIVSNVGTIADLEIDLLEWIRIENGGGE